MIIFFLDEDPKKAGEYHSNFHVAKMLEKYIDMLLSHIQSTGKYGEIEMDIDEVDSKTVDWLSESPNNVSWFLKLINSIVMEYNQRFKRSHDYIDVFVRLRDSIEMYFMQNEIETDYTQHTPFPVVMPDMYIVFENAVDCYRYYYVQSKKRFTYYSKDLKPEFFEQAKYKNKVYGFEANSQLAKMVKKYKDSAVGEAERCVILGFIQRESEKLKIPVDHLIYARYETREDHYFRFTNETDESLISRLVPHLFGDIPIYLVRSPKTGRRVKEYRIPLTDTEAIKLKNLYEFHRAKLKIEREKILKNMTIAYFSKQKLDMREDLDYDYSNEFNVKNGKPIEDKRNHYDKWSAMNIANQMDFHPFVEGIEQSQ